MRAGELRHRIKIQQKSVTRGTMGGEVTTWTDVSTVWAAIEPISGREYYAAQQTQAEAQTRIRIRHLAGITTSMRVLWGTRIYDIIDVLDVKERGREVHLMCKEAV